MAINDRDSLARKYRNLFVFAQNRCMFFWSKLNSYPSFSRNSAGEMNLKKFLVFDFSSFHHIIILQNQKNQKKTKVHKNNKKLDVRYTGLPTILRFSDSQISQIHIFQGCSSIFLVFFEVISWQIRGSRVHYGSKKFRNFRSSQNHPKSIGIDQESNFSHFGIIKTP